MNLDVRTMYIAMAATCFIVAVGLFALQARRPWRDGALPWTLGWAVQGVFWVLLGLRGIIGNFVSIVIATTFLAASYSFLYAAVREFQGRPYNRVIFLFPPGVTFGFFWYFSAYVDKLSYRIIFMSILTILQISAIVWALFHDTPLCERRSSWLTGFAFIIFGVLFLIRLLEGLTLPYEHLSVLQVTAFRNASLMAALGVVMLSSIGFVLMMRDRAEERVQESEQRWATTLASIGDAVIATDVAGRITFMNSIAEALTGWEFNEASQKPVVEVFNIINEQTHQKVENPVNKVLEKGNVVGLANHTVLVRKDGTEVAIDDSGAPIRDLNGRTTGVVLVFRDVTERRRAEEQLRQAEEKSRLLIRYAPSMLYEIDFHRPAFKSVNDAMCQFLGYTREELLAMSPFDLLDEEGKAVFRERMRRILAGEAISNSVEYKSKTKDGREFYSILNMAFTYKDGKPEGAVVVAHDITERKRAEEELRRHRDELEDRVRERTAELRESEQRLRQLSTELLNAQEKERRAVAREIHDSIGASLAATKFKAESALARISADDPQTKSLLLGIIPIIQETVNEARRIQMNLRPSILDDLGILATIGWFCRQYESTYSGIRVKQEINIEEHEVSESLKTVIFRVLQEAMNNIAKHSKANQVVLALRKTDQAIELVVRDNGHGFRMEEVLSRKRSSRGLGLDSMRERTELTGGTFAIDSTDSGTAIQASWPL